MSPKISVIVPSFNQASFLQSTLDSVLVQGYENLELIVVDGGSTDGSVEILERYAPHLSYWVSEPDGGQTKGLIKGFQRSTGDVQCWLNSDDLHEPNTLREVGGFFTRNPDVDAVYGNTRWINHRGQFLREQKEIPFKRFIWMYTYNYIPGMSMFWRSAIYNQVGGLDPTFDLAMDADLWIRFADVGKIAHVNRPWSRMRFYPEQKNRKFRDKSDDEDLRIRQRYWNGVAPTCFRAKKLAAQAWRIGWRLSLGCYPLSYRRSMEAME